jgi:hypothetical protein
MKNILVLCLSFTINACGAQQSGSHSNVSTECEISFEKLDRCTLEASGYALTAQVKTEDIAPDEKLILGLTVNVNDRVQKLTLTEGTTLLDGDIGSIVFTDIDFDNVPDLAITTSFGTPNLYLDYWRYDTLTKEYVPIGNHPQLNIDCAKKTITTTVKLDAGRYESTEWHWVDGKLERR